MKHLIWDLNLRAWSRAQGLLKTLISLSYLLGVRGQKVARRQLTAEMCENARFWSWSGWPWKLLSSQCHPVSNEKMQKKERNQINLWLRILLFIKTKCIIVFFLFWWLIVCLGDNSKMSVQWRISKNVILVKIWCLSVSESVWLIVNLVDRVRSCWI